MSDVKRDYLVLAAAGGRVAGKRVATGSTVSLSDAEAEYEADLGFIRLVGDSAPTPSAPVALTDHFTIVRDGISRSITIADLVALIADLGGVVTPEPSEAGLDLSLPLGAETVPVL